MVSHTKDAVGIQNPYAPLKYVYLSRESTCLRHPAFLNTYRSSWLNSLIIVSSIPMFIAFISFDSNL
jgi:hypothetical protein